jgi:hypothetical protein
MRKRCFKCGRVKRLDLFYRHRETSDGHLGKCKACTRRDVKRRYYDPESRIKLIEYERRREQGPERKKKKILYARNHRRKHPGKTRAREAVRRAIVAGRIQRGVCEICGNPQVEAHHTDYRRRLDVKWLCRRHHMLAEGKLPF